MKINAESVFKFLTLTLVYYTLCVFVSWIIAWAFDWPWTMKTPIGYAVSLLVFKAAIRRKEQ